MHDRLTPHIVTTERLSRPEIQSILERRTLPICFVGVDLGELDLSRLDFSDCTFERCQIGHADFTAAQLENTLWVGCRGTLVNWSSARVTDSQFRSCDLNNSTWYCSTLSQVHFEGCKLTGANFSSASTLGLSFNDCLLVSSALTGISFYKSTLRNLDFSDADLSDCDFREAVFIEGGSLSHTRVNGAKFFNADLREVNLQGLHLKNAQQFKGAIISKLQAAVLLAELGLRIA
ncbi:pentapeptide repeat-containing protein|uniref:pentapeptide repeat-containing protein n=1 Tax=Pseudomonas sp. SbOxS1 TaxID=2723884 RepID=UPI0015D45FBB|nr:pentapeptide repeat-containing protein [Pseudomonas sp. SbOxS1]NYU02528.1 pentapeptide repeat-containing protein [Pseudomonas sp. SbOxS1]